jgi:hypothetical protein
VAVLGSASEKASAAAGSAAAVRSCAVRTRSMATAHSLSSLARQTIITSRAFGRSARPMLVNAATGSAKNIVPKRLIARSNPWSENRCT